MMEHVLVQMYGLRNVMYMLITELSGENTRETIAESVQH